MDTEHFRCVQEVDPATTATEADIRTWDDNGMLKLYIPVTLVDAALFEALPRTHATFTYLGKTSAETFAVKYVLYLTTTQRFLLNEKERLVEHVRRALPDGLWCTYEPSYGNDHYGTLNVQCKRLVSNLSSLILFKNMIFCQYLSFPISY